MNQQLNELFQSYLRADQDDLAQTARQCYCNIVNRFDDTYHDGEFGVKVALAAFSIFVRIDNTLSTEEWSLLQYIYQDKSITRDETFKIIKECSNDDIYDDIKATCKCDDYLKQNILKLGLCVAAIDGEIQTSESRLVQWLLS